MAAKTGGFGARSDTSTAKRGPEQRYPPASAFLERASQFGYCSIGALFDERATANEKFALVSDFG
jgi:hypothetical protein